MTTDAGGYRTASPDLASYRQRRERELSSLYATARSLTALGETDVVLDSIVRAAHELIGTDFTYLSLLGPDGELTLKASEGTISSTFADARVPSGTGVGGRVIATGAPAWVSNYLATRDVPHDRSFDDLVLPEGMVALLGVPLLVGDEVVGVLFAADRTERPFENDEVALLSAFADHAAVALNNARLYDETRSALKELQSAYETIERQVAVMERAQAVHESLTHVVLKGGGAAEIAQLLVDHLQGTVTVFDRTGAVIAAGSPDGAPEPAVQRSSPDAVEQARQSGRWATTTDSTGVWRTAATVQAGDSHLGALLLTRSHEPAPVDIRTLERAAQIMGLLILKETAVAQAEERVSGELLTELLVSSPPVGPTQRARAQARGIDVATLDVLVVAASATRSPAEVSRRLHQLSGDWGGLAGEHLGRATMLAHATDVAEVAESLHARLRRDLGTPVRVVAERVVDQGWGRAFELASRCCGLMQTLGVTDQGTTAGRYSMFALVFDPERSEELDALLRDTVEPLAAHDALRSTQLVATLTAYFHHAGNLSRTARTLHIHLNTLHKRLHRVEALLGAGWRSPDRALHLQLALRLHELRGQSLTG
ncbi:GAF domain-containing protein [Nocardioides sp. SYSU D00038]|uniref:helix-turn-helix domain-containing protein n=1 Tax=Nocardioides sp. SYSU D00038 TaxID=2812554 RepID=UPI001967B662|nr:GAF domain-containing protein [Nocardioides sp. SYSU D00038]